MEIENDELMQVFRQKLQRQEITQARFKVDRHTALVPELLRECYIREVEQRGHKFIEDNYTAEHIAKAAKWLVSEDCKPSLLLFGQYGNGKTTLANAICRLINTLYDSASMKERKSVTKTSALKFATIAKDEPAVFEALKAKELLFIDDVGTEQSEIKSWGNVLSPFEDLIYYRYDKQLFTVMTSNLDLAKLGDKYGARVADRFNEMFDRIGFENGSYR